MMSWRDTFLGETCGKSRHRDYKTVYDPLPALTCLQDRWLRKDDSYIICDKEPSLQ